MFTTILPQQTQETVELLKNIGILKNFYLSGGTACALHLGHRLSEDLDFFTPDEFDVKRLRDALLEGKKLQMLSEDKNTFHCIFNKTRLSFLRYKYPMLESYSRYKHINVSSLIDVLCTKLDTISARGSKKDFIDVYCAIQSKRYALSDIITAFQKKYKGIDYSLPHIMKGLVYFEDAEEEEMPVMKSDVEWKKVKAFFVGEVRGIKL
jgi:predicted nucleotidyltransferase component of viral defense system